MIYPFACTGLFLIANMVNPCLIASYVIAAITFFFTCIALAVTRSHSAGSCGDNMWSMLMATFVLHVLVLPCVVGCMIIPTAYNFYRHCI